VNFDEYWADLDAELAGFPARPVLERMPGRCTADFTGYEVRFSGIGSHRLFGYLSVPTGPGPFPGLLEVPRHGSVDNPPHYHERLRYLVFTPAHRGQRRADSPFAAAYPGLFTRGIGGPATYVYREIVADCLRAAEFLLGHPDLDRSRAGVTGDDLAVLVAARRPGFTALQVTSPLLHDPLRRRRDTREYPLEELNDHLRHHPGDEERLARTLALFEPARHAPAVTARTLLAVPDAAPVWGRDLLDAFGERLETYRLTDRDAVDVRALDAWLADQLGVPVMARFAS
jgi:cephalosporin-C deacetylase